MGSSGVRLNSVFLDSLNLEANAKFVINKPLDHFPHLLLDRCLENAVPKLAMYVATSFASGNIAESEIITMPRRGFGLRPVVVTGPAGRTLYRALVKSIEKSLPEPSRGSGKYDQHRKFGLDSSHEYIVELDIAACYEYIDHTLLHNELLLRSMNINSSEALRLFLEEMSGRSRGLPQMQEPSDRLADAYLSILERKLCRHGYEISRYVDDIRIVADSWETANNIIEHAAEYARELGLILSSEKTRIYRKKTLISQQQEDGEFFNKHIQKAKQTLTIVLFSPPAAYTEGEPQMDIFTPDDIDAARLAYWKVLTDWRIRLKKGGTEGETEGSTANMLPLILSGLRDYSNRIDDKVLSDIVFHSPRRLENVCRYIIHRAETVGAEDHWRTINTLINMARQSPWAKLWLLNTIEKTIPNADAPPPPIKDWVERQLEDRHEYVRSQAAWVRAMQGDLTDSEVGGLYRSASRMTQHALAASAMLQKNISRQVINAIREDSVLNKEAAAWASA